MFYDTKVGHTGRVNSSVVVHTTFDKCTIDPSKYPYDSMQCCSRITLGPAGDVSASVGTLDYSWDTAAPSVWQVQDISVKASCLQDLVQ